MYHGISLVNIAVVGIVLLDVGLIWGCFSIDTHLKFLDIDDAADDAESVPRSPRISHFLH